MHRRKEMCVQSCARRTEMVTDGHLGAATLLLLLLLLLLLRCFLHHALGLSVDGVQESLHLSQHSGRVALQGAMRQVSLSGQSNR